MRKAKGFLILLFFLAVWGLFFWPVLFKGWVPFPGDLLVGNSVPWNSYSFLGYAPGGVPHKAQGIDVVRQLFPWKYFSMEMFKEKQIPLWNPYNFSGNPHLANFQTGVFYPLNIFFLFLPLKTAWTIFISLQPILASFFLYLLLREIKVSCWGAVLGSVAFSYGLYFTVWLEWGNVGHAVLWLPLVLFLAEKLVKKSALKWILLLIFSLTCSLLAGYAQATIYLLVVAFFYFFFRKKLTPFLLATFLALGLSALQLLPTLEIFLNSARQAYPKEKISELLIAPFYLVTSFVPDFFGNPASRNYWLPGTYIERVSYIGVLPLFFAFLAIFCRKEKIIRFFTILAALALLFSLNIGPVRFFYGLNIPLISTMVYTRLLVIFSFSLAVLAGYGFDSCCQRKKSKKMQRLVFGFASFYVFLWIFAFLAPKIFSQSWWQSHLNVTRRNLFLPTFFAFAGSVLVFLFYRWRRISKKLFMAGIGLLILFDLYFYFQKITPFSPSEFIYPQTEVVDFIQKEAGINRFWGYGSAYIDTNFSTFTRTLSPDGVDPLFIRRYGELVGTSGDGQLKKVIPRADVFLTKGYGQEALRENYYRQRLLNLLGVKYVSHKIDNLSPVWQPDVQTFPEEIYQLVWQKGVWQVYENKQALPRIFLVGEYQIEKQDQVIVDLIFDPEFPLEEKVILEEPLPTDFILGKSEAGQVELLDYQPNEIKIKTSALENKLLFFSDNYYPGWQVKIDGKTSEIYRADYSFRAVPVPAGVHKIVFTYKPKLFFWGLRLTLASLAAVILISFFVVYQKKCRKN